MGIQNAKWVRAETNAAPVIRKTLVVENPEGAEIDVCGLGFFELYINGKKVSDDRFVPSWSDYGSRDLSTLTYPIRDSFCHRVYYRSYDLTAYLVRGENVFAFLLGNGWFCQTVREAEGKLSYGTPCLAFSIRADGQEILSDETLEWKESPILFHNIYAGETQDFRHGGGTWRPVLPAPTPGGMLCPDPCPADRVVRKRIPVCVYQDGERTVWDAGENLSGTVSFIMPICKSGAEVVVRHAECFSQDGGVLYTQSAGSLVQTDRYIGDGAARRCEPHFVWHGFRYFEITGPHENPEVLIIHSDVPVCSSFISEHAALNWLYAATVRSLLSNLHAGVISDCPHRERLGYTGDGQLTCDTALTLLSAAPLYEKWLRDIADGQDPVTGHVQHTAPFYGGGGGPGGWGCAIVSVPYFLWKHTGKEELIDTYFPHMERWAAYMEAHSENGLVVREEEGGWCLGEWCTPDEVMLPEPFVNTYFLIKSLDRMAEMAQLRLSSAELWRKKADAARRALKAAYYSEGDHTFCGGVQGADAFALDIGLGNSAMAASLAAKYDALGEFDTGIFGTDILIRVLFETGFGDTALRLLVSEKENTFGGQRARGETTLCERWNVRWASHNHHMFGACTGALFRYLLGIRVENTGIVIAPAAFSVPLAVKGQLLTRFGEISVERRSDETGVAVFTVHSDSDAVFRFQGEARGVPAGENAVFLFRNSQIS